MYCSALLCLIRLAPSWCLPGLAERDSTAQIVWDRCTRNAKVLLTVNSRETSRISPAYWWKRVQSSAVARNQLFMYEMNPTHADNNGAEDTAEVQCSFHQLVYDSSDQLKLRTHTPFNTLSHLKKCLHWEVKLDFYYNNLPLFVYLTWLNGCAGHCWPLPVTQGNYIQQFRLNN